MDLFDNHSFLHEKNTLKSRIELHIAHPKLIDIEENSNILDENEAVRSEAFHFKNDQNLYISSHIFLRMILSQYASIDPKEWTFTHNAYGKPRISNKGYEHLSFNLSHTHSMITCAIGHQYDVGVDIEYRRSLDDLSGLSHLALCPSEEKHILSFSNLLQKEMLFYRYWTLKEACIKAFGKGLSMPLKDIKYTLQEGKPWTCCINSLLCSKTQIYSFSYTMQDRYTLALAVKLLSSEKVPSIRLTNWNMTPVEPQDFVFNILPKN